MTVFMSPEDLQRIIQVKRILEKDFRYHFTQQQLAQKVSTNESKLRHIFKQQLNMTIYEYLTCVRVEKAKELLETTTLPIKMVADRVGYDIRSFNRQFKKITKVAPLVWRRKAYGIRVLVMAEEIGISPELAIV